MKKIMLLYLCALVLTFVILLPLNAQNTRLPYFNGFENPGDTVGLVTKKRANCADWAVGSAQHCLGFKSLYVTPDSGSTASYLAKSGGYVSLAYLPITLPQGSYTLAFDYMMGGDGTNQALKVAWVPSSTAISSSPSGSAFPNAITLNQFTDDSGKDNYTLSAWTHVSGTITVPAGGGTYNLCFAFRCNSTTVVPPGACIDNIQIDTVHASTDCVATPTDITVVNDTLVGVVVSWNGNATSYDIVAASAADPTDYSYAGHGGVTSQCDTFSYSELGEGQYFFYVRPVCGTDTGMYAETSGHFIYDASAHCIDFANFNAPGTQCTYGNYSNPYQTNGYIDNGSAQMSSRHTVNTDLNETDARTNGALHLVPAGEVMSVRLGNWNDGSEAESVCYTYNVPAGSNQILMVKYAVVFEEPGHSESSEFKIEIMDVNNQLLDTGCTFVDVLYGGTLTQGWHSCTCTTASYETIWYKDWSTIGVNLTNYAGQTIKIRLTNYDSNWVGHFGYAYFTLGCSQAELTGVSCGSGEPTEIKAPDGFNYQWTNNCTGYVVSTSQSLPVSGNDTCSYTCRCSFKEQPSCYFNLAAYSISRLPEASFAYSFSYSNCQTHISFNNNSFVYDFNNGRKDTLPYEHITNQIWTVRSQNLDAAYRNVSSSAANLSTIDVPKEGDVITVTLTSFVNGCDDDTIVTIVVPPLNGSHKLTSQYVCVGTPVSLNQRQYTFIGRDSIEVIDNNGNRSIVRDTMVQVIDTFQSTCGCDSIRELQVKALIADSIYLDTIACTNSPVRITRPEANDHLRNVIDTVVTESGIYTLRALSSSGCDSLYMVVNVTIKEEVKVIASPNDVTMGRVTGGGVYCYADSVTLTATANEHYHFVSWSNGQTDSTITIVVDRDTTLTAMFEADNNTAVEKVSESSNIILIPNPVRVGEPIHINSNFTDEAFSSMTVEIFSMNDIVVKYYETSLPSADIEGINVAGTYIVRVTTDKGKVYIQKLIVR